MYSQMHTPWPLWLFVPLEAAALFVVATLVFDVIHYTLHQWQKSRWRLLRHLANLHQAHHDFCDRSLCYHDGQVRSNLLYHVIPEYVTQMAVCTLAFAALHWAAVGMVMGVFTTLFVAVVAMRGKDRNHAQIDVLPPAHGTVFVLAPYHALHHVYPESCLSSYVTLFDRVMGTSCQIRGRRIALTGASGSFGSALLTLLEHAGAEVIPLKYGADYRYDDYSGADAVLQTADILVLAHGAKGELAMSANCDSFLALIDRFKNLALSRKVPKEVWAVGSEIECHPAFGVPELRSYARSKRAFARAAARLFHDPDVLYRHIVPSAFRSRMGPGLMSGRAAAAVAFWLIRHGFRYVPVTYTGIALVNFIPFFVRALAARPEPSRRARLLAVASVRA